jgi:PucR C-terminal helix-turn-helix domain/GGDEF-like domain
MSHSTSLAIVSEAVAGDGLERVARSASKALGHPVAVICPSPGAPVVWPAEAVPAARLDELAAAATAIVRLMGDGFDDPPDVVNALVAGPPGDVDSLVDQARRLGIDLTTGAIAICGLGGRELVDGGDALVASVGGGRVVVLVALTDGAGSEREAGTLAERLRGAGWLVGVSAPRRQPALLHEAVREAMLLAELSSMPEGVLAGQEETYRLLIGVLLRDPTELELLRTSTISPLLAYDAEHGTELLVTLGTFLARHGSTTETAEAMQLHRHTVGYRLSRVQEVSGLSPYESDGRERLSLGLKAAQILAAQARLTQSL